jgi:hypothetical protein
MYCEWWKSKDSKNKPKAFNNFFITITEKLNIQKIDRTDATSIIEDSFPGILSNIKIIPITEAKIKGIIHSLKPKESSHYNEITSES